MVDQAREDLLGYLLGALEESDRESVENRLEKNPRLLEELALVREGLDPLWVAHLDYDPPPGLAERTCRRIAAHPAPGAGTGPEPSAKPTPRSTPLADAAVEAVPSGWGRFASLVDLTVAAGIVGALFLLAFPAIHNSRFHSRRFACADHLRQIGLAVSRYSQTHDGYFPPVYDQGRYAGAGIYAPILVSQQFLDGSHWFVCPGSPLAEDRDFRVPSLEELLTASLEELDRLRARMGGSYGYNLGFEEHGRYHTPRYLGRAYYPLISDVPSNTLPDRQSVNHGGRGQNVLKEDGSVDFCRSPRSLDQTDDMFVNERGMVAAGNHRNDAVIAPSDAVPRQRVQVTGGTHL